MGHLRALLRMIALAVSTSLVYLGWALTRPLGWISSPLGVRSHSFWMRTWARSSLTILGARVQTRGSAPRPPFFLVSNHLSYVDIVVLFACADGLFLSKAEVARWPVLGFLARSTGTLFVDRTRKQGLPEVIDRVRQALADGHGVVVFPEGTSTDGAAVKPFRSSIFEVPVQTGIPVSYASLSYSTPAGAPPAHLAVCWWGDMSFSPHFYRLLTLPSFDASVTFGADRIVADDRKSLATRAQEAVANQFTPVAGCRA